MVTVPCEAPKLVPLIVNPIPTGPCESDKLVTVGAGKTMNATPALGTPVDEVTTTFPVVAPVGTTAVAPTLVHPLTDVAAMPLNVTVPVVAPKLVPPITIDDPMPPLFGVRPPITGVLGIVNETPLLETPPAAVTTTLPVVAPVGTTAVTLVLLHGPIVVAAVPLNFTVPLPWLAPKFVPAITTEVPTGPDVGARLVTLGAGTTVNPTPALATPPDEVTTTFPVVAPVGTTAVSPVLVQPLTAVAVTPLNFTVPVVVPKLDPAITIDDPMAPLLGVRLVMAGGTTIVKFTPALATPPAAVTTTFPVVAPAGTTAVTLVLLHGPTDVATTPLNFTVPFPWLAPKFVPVITTDVPTGPDVGARLVMLGAATTVNPTPALATPPDEVTTTFPLVAPVGTTAVTPVLLHPLTDVAAMPLNFTVPVVVPKLDPAMTIDDPMAPLLGVRPLITGVLKTVKATPLLETPPAAVTTTLPVVAPVGTTAVTLVLLHGPIEVAARPLNFTVPFPWLAPKFVPVITTDVPTGPDVGARLVMLGAATTVNATPALATPLDEVTTTFPVVAPVGTTAVSPVLVQPLTAVAVTPLNFTVPVVVPKLDPAITIDDPMAPLLGVRLVIAGGTTIVKLTPLLETPPAAVTTTLPVVAPAGTTAVTLVLLHGPIVVAAMPLNFTVPLPWLAPKFVPVITTEVPTGPEVGARLVMLGAATTVNPTPALATPPDEVTTTFPLVAPVGTTAVTPVLLHPLTDVAAMPLNFTVPVVVPKLDPAMTIDDPMAPLLGVRLVMLGTTTPPAGLSVAAIASTCAFEVDEMFPVAAIAAVPLTGFCSSKNMVPELSAPTAVHPLPAVNV